MALTDLLIRGSSVAVVVFVVSSTLGVGLSLTVGQILAPLKNARLVVLSLAANFVLAPLVALGLWRVLGLDEPLGIGLLLCGLAAGAPFLIKLAEFAKADLAFAVGLMVLLMVVTVGYLPLALPLFLEGIAVNAAKIARSLVVLMLLPLAVGLLVRARRPGAPSHPTRRWVALQRQHDPPCGGVDHGWSLQAVSCRYSVPSASWPPSCTRWSASESGDSSKDPERAPGGCWRWGRRRETPPRHSWSPGRTSMTRRSS